MRAVELAKVAAAAEALRLRRMVRRQGMRAVYGAVAAVFAIAVLVSLHVVGYDLLASHLSPVVSALIVLVVDLVIAGIFGALAMRDSPDTVETEALEVRRQAVHEMRRAVTTMAVAGEVGSMILRRRAKAAVSSAPGGRAWIVGEILRRLWTRR